MAAELKVVQPIKPAVNADAVALLDMLLTQAKDGKIRSVAVCYAQSDGTISTSLEVDGDKFAMSHAIGALWWRYQKSMHDNAYPPEDV